MKSRPVLLTWLIAATLTASPWASAKVTGIFVWRPEPHGVPLLLPEIEGEAPSATAARYAHAINEDPDYRKLAGATPPVSSDQGPISHPEHFEPSITETPFGVIANRPGQMNSEDRFLKRALASLKEAGARAYVIPLGLENALTPSDLHDFHALLALRLPALVSLGGGDIDPSLYGQPNRHARNTFLKRDQTEHDLVSTFIKTGKGAFYGFCRGHQMCSVVLGYELHQDLEAEGVALAIDHALDPRKATDEAIQSAWHDIDLVDQDNSLYEATGRDRIRVNSRHHQAVKPSKNETGRIIAYEGGKVVEAIKLKGRGGLTLQFHPEDMGTEDSERILKWMVRNARVRRAKTQSCLGMVLTLLGE